MRYTVSALALASLLCLPVGATFAQQDDSGAAQPQNMHRMRQPMTVDEQLQHMTQALNLTSDQQAQIKPLLEQRREQMMAFHQDQSLSRDDRMAKMQTLDNDSHSKIAGVLNDQQKAKFEQMAQRREHNMDRQMNGGGGNPQQ